MRFSKAKVKTCNGGAEGNDDSVEERLCLCGELYERC